MTSSFVPVRLVEDIPAPHYRGMLGPDALRFFQKGEARKALDWLRARGSGFRLVSILYDGDTTIEREVARNL